MILRPTELPAQHSIDEGTARPIAGQRELVAAIANLSANVEKLAVLVQRIITLGETAKAMCRGKVPNSLEVAAGTDIARNLQAGCTTESTDFPLSPHQDSWRCNAQVGEISDEPNSRIEVTLFNRRNGRSRAKNAIAGRVLDLHDRLGGFIKPLPPRLDQKP